MKYNEKKVLQESVGMLNRWKGKLTVEIRDRKEIKTFPYLVALYKEINDGVERMTTVIDEVIEGNKNIDDIGRLERLIRNAIERDRQIPTWIKKRSEVHYGKESIEK